MRTLLMCLLFEVLEIQGWAAATAVGLDKAWTPLREPRDGAGIPWTADGVPGPSHCPP